MADPNHFTASPPVSSWAVIKADDASKKMLDDDLVMAWAEDQITGEPRYIGELSVDQRGGKCNCRCISCKKPLTAVNAAKQTFRKRPHFRHPAGAEKNACLVMAARFAALQMLKSEGILELPRRRHSEQVTGLSGKFYQSWVELPPERVRVSDFGFSDYVSAILTLDDGRQLKIRLLGRIEAVDNQSTDAVSLIPTILLVVDDPHIAAMSPDELKKRLRLIVDDGIWCSHWNENTLIAEATRAAHAKAAEALDWLDNISDFPADISDELKRETLLHIKAKEILEREKRIFLPALYVEAEAKLSNGSIQKLERTLREHVAQLEFVVLEKRIGRIRPDVVAKTVAAGEWLAEQLLIEITVTNTITDERIDRIRRENIPAIEIDISRMGGIVTEAEFTRLIIEEQAGKRWLFHPCMEREKSLLEIELADTVAKDNEERRKHYVALSLSAREWGRQYLEAVLSLENIRTAADVHDSDPEQLSMALDRVKYFAENLAIHGYSEVNDDEIFRQQERILARLLSMKLNKSVGYKFESAWQVINSILQEKSPYSAKWQTLYLIGIRVWQPTLNKQQAERVAKWRSDVKQSLEANEPKYQRDRKYDRLLSLLFPELADALSKPLGKSNSKPVSKSTGINQEDNNLNIPKHLQNPWLTGKELEEWKTKNPESAKLLVRV